MPCGDAETAPGDTRRYQNAISGASSRYSRSIVRNYLQFVPVCRSLLQFVPFTSSLKICRESMGSNLGHGFSARGRAPSWATVGHEGWRVGSQGVLIAWQERSGRQAPFLLRAFPGRRRPSASARAYRAFSILATNSLAHRIASSTFWSAGRPSARAAYISSHPLCLAMAGGQACARL